MKKIIFLVSGILLYISIFSQTIERQVLSSSGGDYSNTNLRFNFTIGEAVVETFQNSGLILTQGFQQAFTDTPRVILDSVKNVSCFGATNGAIYISIQGGNPSYSFAWSNSATTEDLNNISAGTYYITVSDNSGQSVVDTFEITEPAQILTNNLLAICFGDSTFLAGSWQSANGNYNDTLVSVNGCDSIITTQLTVNPIPQTSAITGSLTVIENELKQYSVTNNSGSTYQWTATNGTLAGGQGTNTVFVQWGNTGIGSLKVIETNNGCSGDTVSITVTIGNVIPCDSLQIAVTGQNIICNGQCNGAASVQVVVGNPPYTYIWNDAYYQQTSSISNLCIGSYSVTVFDYYNCNTSGTYTVTQPAELALNISTTPASCGQNNGSASATVTGGTQPYTYAWTSGSLLSTADSLTAGVYMLTVTDANSCSKFTLANISNSTGPTITANNVTNLTCFASGDGAINITVSGGSTPYTFSWSNGSSTEDISTLTEGPYEVEITDTSGCMATASYFVTQPNQLNAVATTFPATCGNTNGAATITATGGSQSYSYVWSNGGTSATLSNLAPGTYTVSVSDSQYCTATPVMVNINTTSGPIITVDSILQTGCSGSDGAIYTSVSGGTSPYTYLWSNGATTSNLELQTSNTYSLTVTDSNSCVAATSAEITSVVPSVPQICIVTVDSTEHKNLIVWEKEISSNIAYYNIYREGSWAGYYFLAGSVNYDDYSQFLDVNSNPKMRAYRYKITAVDQCGNESEASEPHKTIHLAINDGIGGSWNLIWTEYEGFNFPGYYIYRHINSEGWTLIDSIATGYNSYTDFPPNQGQLFYMIAINSPQICTPTGISKTQSGPYSQSISNIDEYGIWIKVNSVTNNKAALNVYPNPTDGKFYISINGLHNEATLNIFDVTGKTVLTETLPAKTTTKQVDFGTLPKGIYAVKVTSGDVVKVSRIVLQ